MKIKTLVILLIILGILAGAGTLIIRLKTPERTQGRLGNQLFEQLPANEIVSITVKGSDETVSLVKKEDRWVVENRFDYPADFSKISDLVRKLKEVKVGRQFESSEDTLRRLSLKYPEDSDAQAEEKGIQIHLRGAKEALLTSVLVGKTRKTGDERTFPGGQYVMLDQDPKIYLIDKHFSFLDKEPSAWLEKNLIQVKADELRKISCIGPDKRSILYAFERPEKGRDLEPTRFPPDSKVKKSALNRLAGALSSLRMEDVVDPSAAPDSLGMEFKTRIDYHLFNGIIYRIYPGKACSEADKCHLKLKVDSQKPVIEKKQPAEDMPSKGKETRPRKTPEEYALEAKQLNERLSPWVYVIPKWQHNAFLTHLDQLLEEPENEKAGS